MDYKEKVIEESLRNYFETKGIVEIICNTLMGISFLKDHYKGFENLTGTYAQVQYNGLKEAEYLTKQYLIEFMKKD